MGKQVRDEQGVVRREAALECLAQDRQLRAQLSAREIGKHFGVRASLAKALKHRAPRGTEHVRRHACELDVRVFEQLLESVSFALALPDQRLAIAR